MKLYHKDIGIRENSLKVFVGRTFTLNYTDHALQAMLTDRYGLPKRMPKTVTVQT